MTEPKALDALYLALNDSPADPVTTLALADWYEEQGDAPAAECLRWAVARQRWPYRYDRKAPLAVSCKRWHDGWLWWAVEGRRHAGDWGHPRECRLPFELWDALPHTFHTSPSVFKEYPTGRDAYEALLAAWPAYRRRARHPL
jgi:uncharacterized protein (TIGR02996 family)